MNLRFDKTTNNNADMITESQINKITKSKVKGLDEAEKQVKDLSKVSANTKVGKQCKQVKINSVTDDALFWQQCR